MRTSMEAALRSAADLSVRRFHPPSWLPDPNDPIAEHALLVDDMLHNAGAEWLLLSRLSKANREIWRHGSGCETRLDATLVERSGHSTDRDLAIVAFRFSRATSDPRPYSAVVTTIGHRAMGSSLDVIAFEAPPQLVSTANSVIAWREDAGAEQARLARAARALAFF